MHRRLPFSSAAYYHRGWRYERFIWAFQLDVGRARHAEAEDALDNCTSFVPGQGALALMVSIRIAFKGGFPRQRVRGSYRGSPHSP